MSMFGAVDLSTFASGNKTVPASSNPAGTAPAPAQGAGAKALELPLIVAVNANNLRTVVETSAQVPVVVVVHTARAQASEELTTLLAQIAQEFAGAFQLATVDADEALEVAQALQVTAVPTVLALLAGQPVPLFQGAIDAQQLRTVLDQLLQVAAANGITGRLVVAAQPQEPVESELEQQVRQLLAQDKYAEAINLYDHAIAQNPTDASLQVQRNKIRLRQRMAGKNLPELLATADANPADVNAALTGADAALTLGDVDAALGRALDAVRTHTGEEREQARLHLLELFDVIGGESAQVARARRQLATLLF